MYKTGNVLSYLKSDNYRVFRQFVENEIAISEICDKFNVSHQLVISVLKQIDPDVMKKREQDIDYRLEILCDMVFEGIPMDYIIEELDVAEPLRHKFDKSPINSRKDATIAKIKRRGVEDAEKVRSYTTIRKKLRFYISTLQIENEIMNTPDETLNLRAISSKYGVSYNKVLERNRSIRRHGRAITSINDGFYQVLKRNVMITERYCRGESMSILKRENKDLRYLDVIIKSYEPYVKVVR